MRVVATPGVRKSVWLVAGAAALVALAVLVLALSARERVEVAPTPAPARSALQPEVTTIAETPPAANESPQNSDAKKPVSRVASRRRAASPIEPPSREDVPFSFGKPGEKSGIELFPAHGSKPTKVGIVVPDDFELPEGYVRHFQATDDGELLPAVLLFHPDYEWLDDAGEVIELPADRVVPPELAPPGLPIQMLELQSAPDAAR